MSFFTLCYLFIHYFPVNNSLSISIPFNPYIHYEYRHCFTILLPCTVLHCIPLTLSYPSLPSNIPLTSSYPSLASDIPLTSSYPSLPSVIPLTSSYPFLPSDIQLTSSYPSLPNPVITLHTKSSVEMMLSSSFIVGMITLHFLSVSCGRRIFRASSITAMSSSVSCRNSHQHHLPLFTLSIHYHFTVYYLIFIQKLRTST